MNIKTAGVGAHLRYWTVGSRLEAICVKNHDYGNALDQDFPEM